MKNIAIAFFVFLSFVSTAQQTNAGILITQTNTNIYDNAIGFYSGEIERNPKDVKSILLRSEMYKAQNRMDKANADIDLAMSINPYSYLYLNKSERNKFFARRNYSYFNMEKSAPGINFKKSYVLEDEYNRLIEGNNVPVKSKSLFEYALIAIDEGDFDTAEHMLSTLNGIDNQSPLYNDIKGVLYIEKGEIENAIASFSKAIELDTLFTIAYHNRAVAHKMLNNLEASERDFNKALKQRVDIAKVAFSKAKLMEMKGDVDGARYFYENAISTQDDYVEARLNYSVLLKAAGEYTRALIEINDLIDEYPENADNYYVRGGLHFIYGEYSNAVKDFDKYLSSNPEDYDVIFYRGLCHVLDGSVLRGCADINDSISNGYSNHGDIYLFMCE